MRQQHKHYYCIRAYADGWKIEYLASSNNKWYPSEYPEFAKNLAYRVVPDENGWLPWYGGECPVDPGTVVETRVGYCVGKSRKAGDYIWGSSITAYRVIEEKADPYAELKAAAKDPTKQIRCGKNGTWADAGTAWAWERPVQDYEIRNKPKKMKLLAYINPDNGYLTWSKEGFPMTPAWKRVPSEDKEIEVEE
jgi:hypothetical protein